MGEIRTPVTHTLHLRSAPLRPPRPRRARRTCPGGMLSAPPPCPQAPPGGWGEGGGEQPGLHTRGERRPCFFSDTEVFWPPLPRPQQGQAQEGCHHTPHSLSVSSPKEDTGQARGFREQQVVMDLCLVQSELQETCCRTESTPQDPELSIWVSLMRFQEPVHLGCPGPSWSGFSGGPEAKALSSPQPPAP